LTHLYVTPVEKSTHANIAEPASTFRSFGAVAAVGTLPPTVAAAEQQCLEGGTAQS